MYYFALITNQRPTETGGLWWQVVINYYVLFSEKA